MQPGRIDEGQEERASRRASRRTAARRRWRPTATAVPDVRPCSASAQFRGSGARPRKSVILILLEQRKRRRVVADEPIEVAVDEERRPRLGRGTVAGVGEIARFQAASARLARVRDAALERPAPEVDVRVELLVDLRAPLDVVEAPVDVQGQRRPTRTPIGSLRLIGPIVMAWVT